MRTLGGLPLMNKVTKLAFALSPTLQVRYTVFVDFFCLVAKSLHVVLLTEELVNKYHAGSA